MGQDPVHLNLAFREPLVGRAGSARPNVRDRLSSRAPRRSLVVAPLSGRGLIIAGAGATKSPDGLVRFRQTLGWPLLADPRSGCRVDGTIAAADAIVRAKRDFPTRVLLLGAPWLSKVLGEYVAAGGSRGARVIAVDPWQRWVDPSHVVTEFHHADPDAWMAAALQKATPS